MRVVFSCVVSIQPKPKKGLVDGNLCSRLGIACCFNPAEAEEGFSRIGNYPYASSQNTGFNPAEAEEGFSSL